MSEQSPFMTIEDVAAFLLFDKTAQDPSNAARQWLRRRQVATFKRGRFLLVWRSEVMDALAAEKRSVSA